jgi:hypothetical protein
MALILLYGSPAFALTSNSKVAPPGNSGVGEYQEDVPGASGGHAVLGQTLTPRPGVLTPTVTRKLNHSGKAGRRTAILAEGTAPAGHPSDKTATAFHRVLARQNGEVLGSLTRSLTGSGGGLGALLPILLGASLLAAIALALRRRGDR